MTLSFPCRLIQMRSVLLQQNVILCIKGGFMINTGELNLFLFGDAGHTGLIPPSHFETRRQISSHPFSLPVPPPPSVCEPWADLARELAQLRQENEVLRKTQERGEGMRSRSLERQTPEGPPTESRALEIIAHQIKEIRRLELAVADAQEKEEKLKKLEQEVQELRLAQKEGAQAEEKRRLAEEAAARQCQEELVMMMESHKTESETLRRKVQALEAKLKEGQEQRIQEVTRLQEELQAANQERAILYEQLSRSRLELDSQNSLVQQLRTYIGELVPDNRQLEEQKRERLELQSTIQALEKERDVLQTSSSLLQTRLSSLTHILSLQESELCKKGLHGDGDRSQILLSRWREKVFCLMVQLKSEEINKENDSRKISQKVLSLENSLQESGHQQILLTHTLQDRTAELEMERVRIQSLQDELSASQATSTQQLRRAEKAEQAVLHLKQMVDNFVQTMSAQEASLRGALLRLVTLGQRVSFATKRVDTTQGLVAQRLALIKLTEEERPKDTVTEVDFCRPSYEDLEKEVKLLHEERDRLSKELKHSAVMIESKVTEAREKFELELAECHRTTSLLRQSLSETERRESELREKLEETERRLQETCENAAQLRETLQGQKGEYERVLQSRVSEIEEQNTQQLAQMEKHLQEARREHTKAVVALRQAERQMQREKTRSQETMRTMEDAARTREEQLSRQIQEAERDKNLMIATLRQEGLLTMYQRNRTAVIQTKDRGEEKTQILPETQTSAPHFTHAKKESISSILDNLQSLGASLLRDDEEEEEGEDN
ncbi:coiled-coil alpha-helical rod protein 1 [Rhinophrynus dorsalis]